MKISGIYKITNLETNDCYIGSSKDVKNRWKNHKVSSQWKKQKNNKLYIDFQKYGLDKFSFEILEETTNLKEREQYYIDLLKPNYNNRRANGFDLESREKSRRKYDNQLCNYNGEIITLNILRNRLRRKGIIHSCIEAKKFLIK